MDPTPVVLSHDDYVRLRERRGTLPWYWDIYKSEMFYFGDPSHISDYEGPHVFIRHRDGVTPTSPDFQEDLAHEVGGHGRRIGHPPKWNLRYWLDLSGGFRPLQFLVRFNILKKGYLTDQHGCMEYSEEWRKTWTAKIAKDWAEMSSQ